MDLSSFSKAIAGGLVAALVAVLSKYGLNLSVEVSNALGVLVYAVVGYAIGHAVVFFAPANKTKIVVPTIGVK